MQSNDERLRLAYTSEVNARDSRARPHPTPEALLALAERAGAEGGRLETVIPFLSGAAAIGLGAVMIVASLVELFVLHRPPLAALACLSAHTLIAWRRVGRASATSPRGAIEPAVISRRSSFVATATTPSASDPSGAA